MKISENIFKKLLSKVDPQYQAFSQKMIPNVTPDRILGIRLPELRKITIEVIKEHGNAYFREKPGKTHEERLLYALAITYVKNDMDIVLPLIEKFIPHIDNWAVCDTFCTGLKITQKDPKTMWKFIQPYLLDNQPYYIRFALVMLLAHYISDGYIQKVLKAVDRISHDDYYVKMAQAWLIATCFAKFSMETMAYLKKNRLDTWTFNKAIQKITESYRVTEEDKEAVRKLRRK